MSNKNLAILGSGDLGQLIAHHSIICGFSLVGFYDDFQIVGKKIGLGKVLGNTSEIEKDYKEGAFQYLMIGIGYKHFTKRKEFFELFFSKGISFPNLIHPTAYLDKSATLGFGNFILPGCVLDSNVILENNVLLNTSVTIAHDSTIKSHSFLGPRVALAGKIIIEECCFLGINSTVIDNISISQGATIGGGAVVTRSITEPGVYIGIPAKKIIINE